MASDVRRSSGAPPPPERGAPWRVEGHRADEVGAPGRRPGRRSWRSVLVDERYAEALATLREHRDNLEKLARRLLETETLDAQQASEAAGLPCQAAAAAERR